MCYGYIYLIEDTTNGMRYIGQHKYKNFMLDNSYHGSGRIIKKIMKKRPETLKMEYLMGVNSIEEANFFENYWIEKLNTIKPNGYNLNSGGDVNIPSEETIKRLVESHIGHKWTEEQRIKNYEKHKNGKCSKKITQYTLDGVFVAEYPSLAQVNRDFGYSQSNLSKCCLGKRKSAYGYIWRFGLCKFFNHK